MAYIPRPTELEVFLHHLMQYHQHMSSWRIFDVNHQTTRILYCNAITPALKCFGIMSSLVVAFLCIWVALLWRLIMIRLYCTYCSTRLVVGRKPVSLLLTMYTECQHTLSIHRPVLGKGASEPQPSGKS